MVEGIVPKVDGDILYSSEVNRLSAGNVANDLREQLGLGSTQFINRYFNTSPGTSLIGSTNMINQGGSIFPFFSGNSNFTSSTIDEFSDSVVGSVWGSIVTIVTTSTFSVTEDANYMTIAATTDGQNNSTSATGSIFWSGTVLNNMFNEYSGYFRIMMGSVVTTRTDTDVGANATIKFGNQTIFDINALNLINVSGMMIDIMRMGSNSFYFRINSGTAGIWQNWNGPFTQGSPALVFYASTSSTDLDDATVSMKIDNIRSLSGNRNLEFIFSGGLPGSTSYYTNTSFGPTVVTMHGEGNYESGVSLNLSLNRGVNYTLGSLNRWTNITIPGSVLTLKYTQSGTWYSGLQTGVVITSLGAQFY